MDIFDYLKKATTARLINWKPTGEEVKTKYQMTWRGYEAVIDGFKVTTIIRPHKGLVVSGIIIEKDGKSESFTDNPKVFAGTKSDEVWHTVLAIQTEMENRDIVSSLRQLLARMLFS